MGQQDSGYSAGSILLTFFLGAIVGAGVALLVAPKTGEETRRKIKELAEDAKEKAEDYIVQVKGKTATYVDKGKEILEKEKALIADYVDKGKEFVEKEKSIISKAVEAGKEAYEKEKKS
ncbi:MAG: YtxH domain-containing protein [Syntrophorhabdaceae bacterium]|nr:YtxH domain-containing protein [Syntrophorhabdaceae bacterium]